MFLLMRFLQNKHVQVLAGYDWLVSRGDRSFNQKMKNKVGNHV